MAPPRPPGAGDRPVTDDRDLLARRVPALRAELVRQQGFRREQLASLAPGGSSPDGLAGRGPDREESPGLSEVQALVESGARHALGDIELALARIRTGRYGRCRACGAVIPLAVLEAIPQTTLCLRCCRLRDRIPRAGRHRGPRSSGRRSERRAEVVVSRPAE